MKGRARRPGRGHDNGGGGQDRDRGVPSQDTPAGAPAAANPANTYLYGIVRWPLTAAALAGPGVGDPPGEVRAVRAGPIAAVVSDVWAADMSAQGIRGMRRDMKAHSAVLNALAAEVTVLPARFGVVLPNEKTLRSGLLEGQGQILVDHLDRLDGTVEITLRATYVEEQILREVVASRPELAGGAARSRGGRSASMASESRIELGRQIAAAIQEEQDRDARWLVDVLRPLLRDVRFAKPLTDMMVLNAALLVERAKVPKFDRTLEKINGEVAHRMTFDCVGPLPPYSFVDLKL